MEVSAPAQAEQEVKFLRKFLLGGESWRVGVVNLAVLVCVLRTTAKRSSTFWGKSAPQRKSLLPTDETPSYTCSVYNCTAATQGGGGLNSLNSALNPPVILHALPTRLTSCLSVYALQCSAWTSYSAMAPAAIFHLRKWSMPCKMRRWNVLTLSALLLHGPWWQNSFVTLRRPAYYDKFMLFTLDTH